MTLSECIKKHDLAGCMLCDCWVVYPGHNNCADLYGLSDYVVSSVSGGCIWLIKQKGCNA